jgi:hypothetical protein
MDKIIYIAEHNDTWDGAQHGDVFINGVKIERFRTSYNNNPFAAHYSKLYSRYLATRIPAYLIKPTDNFITLKIDMTK